MSKNIGIAGFEEVLHEKCHKPIARIGVDDVLQIECTRRGCREWVPLPGWVQVDQMWQALDLILSGQVSPSSVLALVDSLVEYRQIEGLIVFGPREWEQKAMIGPKGENPLGLQPGWCPRVPLPSGWTPDFLRRCVKWGRQSENDCVPALVLCLSKAGEDIVSLANAYRWWGTPGIIHAGIQYAGWFVRRTGCPWADEPVVAKPTWKLAWLDFPAWIAMRNWEDQQKTAGDRGLTVSDVKTAVLVLDLLAINGRRFLTETFARTSTFYEGDPLYVGSYSDGVFVARYWLAESVNPRLGAFLEGVPKAVPLGS